MNKEKTMKIFAYILSALSLLMSGLYFVKLKFPSFMLMLKLLAVSLSRIWAIMGIAGAVLGWLYQAPAAIAMGLLGAGWMTWYVWRNTCEHNGFEKAFGADWSDQIRPEQSSNMVPKRRMWALKMDSPSDLIWERDVPFWKIPNSDRELLCDIWRPGDDNISGLAFIYFHGSGWWIGDKDYYKTTRPLFNHLVAQGHTVMDVAYRLCPEVDIYGMVGDAKRAIAWMKENASRYGVDPEKIVIAGGSAGAHIALLAGYTPEHAEFKPTDLNSSDLSVCGIVSYYGPIDLVEGYHRYTVLQLEKNPPPVSIGKDIAFEEKVPHIGRLDILLNGHPQDIPDIYQLANPTTHVNADSPPTLLFQGDKDVLCPWEPTIELFDKLVDSGVPAIKVIYPWTEHGFDLLLSQFSPPAQSALYDVDRFLALLVNKD
jgi:acetyl esterase/lipase